MDAAPQTTPDPLRAIRVYRRWRAAKGPLVVRFWNRAEFWRDMPVVIVAFALLAALYVESELWWGPPLFRNVARWTRWLDGRWIAALWGVTWLGNLALFVVLAGRLGRDPGSRWVRWGIALPAWSRRCANAWMVGGWGVVLNGLCLLLTATWLVAPDELPPLRRSAAAVYAVALHGVVALALRRVARGNRTSGRWSRVLHRAAPWSALAPAWVGFLVLAALLAGTPSSRREASCVAAAFSRTRSPGRLPRWHGAVTRMEGRWASLPWWRRLGEPRGPLPGEADPPSRSDLGLLSLCRVWAFLGFFQAVLLAGTAPAAAGALLLFSLLLLAVGVVRLTWETGRRLAGLLHLRRLPDDPPLGWYGTAGPAAVLVGLGFGRLLRAEPQPAHGVLLALVGAFLGILFGLGVMIRQVWRPETASRRLLRDPFLLWGITLMILSTLLGLPLAVGGEGAARVTTVVQTVAAGCWVGHPVVGVLHLSRLLHPLSLHDLRSPVHRLRFRLVLVVLSIAALAPLGGLAAPLWIHLRFRVLRRSAVILRSHRVRAVLRAAGAAP